jgi:hypothetical protein
MSQKDMKKKDFLDNYRNLETSIPEYDNELTEKIDISGFGNEKGLLQNESVEEMSENVLSDLWKYTRALLMFYMDNSDVAKIYNEELNETKDYVSDEEIEQLAKDLDFSELLKYLSDEKLKDFARDNDIPVRSDREKLEKLIIHEILQG